MVPVAMPFVIGPRLLTYASFPEKGGAGPISNVGRAETRHELLEDN